MKKLLIASGVAVLAFATVASAATFTANLTVGSTGSDVTALQTMLVAGNYLTMPAGVSMGYFGSRTKAAVQKYQAAHAVPSTGFVGPLTRAALNGSDGMTMAPTTPASWSCPVGYDCTPKAGTTVVIDNGSNNGTISGPTGTLTSVNKLGSYNNTKVSESERDVKVLGIEVTAKDGDQLIDTLKVALKNTSGGASSAKITKYATDISVWLDGKEIGRKAVTAFSDDANDLYTYRFTGMKGIVKQNMKSQIIVAISGVSSMDSTDATNETWYIGAGTVQTGDGLFLRAVSSDGRFDDYGPSAITSSINFQKAGGVSADQKYKVNTASNNPVAATTQVSRTSDTNDKLLLAFDVKAENGAMKVQRLPVNLTAAAAAGGDVVVPNVEAIVKSVKLYANGVKIADESVTTGTGVITITFGNSSKLQYLIDANATAHFEVRADLNDIENTGLVATDFDEGDTIKADYSSTNVTNSTVELNNVNEDNVANRTGSATGEVQTARSTGVLVTMGTASNGAPITNTSGDILSRTIDIPVTVKAFDDTVYLARAANIGTTVTNTTSAVAVTVEASDGTTKTVTGATVSLTSSSATVEGSAYRVDSGTEKLFNVSVTLPGIATETIKQYHVQLNAIQSYLASDLTTGENEQTLTPANSFETTPNFTLSLN